MEGYVKVWRKTLESPVWENANLFYFWCWCLMKATYKARVGKVGYQDVPLEPGQFIFGRHIASKETHLSERTIRTCCRHLKNMGNVTIKATNKYSIISIVNWAKYQEDPTSKATNKRPASDQQATTDKKDKKDKNIYNIYGEFKNVKLTDIQYQKLKDKFNSKTDSMIEALSEGIESHGYKYKSHYATILSWQRRDNAKTTRNRQDTRGLPNRTTGYTDPNDL